MRASWRLVVVWFVLGFLASSVTTIAAQDVDASADEGLRLPVVVTGDAACTVIDRGTQSASDAMVRGGRGVRDQWIECAYTMSDPRVSGNGFLAFNDACFDSPGGQACVMWGASEVVGPDGGWGCSLAGTGDPYDHNDGLASAVCAGTEAYEGLTYMWHMAVSFSGKGDFGGETNMYGLIYEGLPPPVQEPIGDPVKVVVAKQDAVAGYIVVPTLRVVSAAEVGPEVYTDVRDVKGRTAAVDIRAGEPITPDLLEPQSDE